MKRKSQATDGDGATFRVVAAGVNYPDASGVEVRAERGAEIKDLPAAARDALLAMRAIAPVAGAEPAGE